MSKNHTHTRKSIARTTIAAAAISAVGVLALPAPAQAAPMIPLAPACNQYGFNGSFGLAQTNNYQMWFNSTGTTAQGRALSLPVNGNQASRDSGDITGGVEGRNLNLSVRWDNGSNGIYSGTVGDDGIARGTGYDQTHPESRTSWESTKPLDCIVPATAPADTPPPPPQTATVTEDVDVYDAPGGEGNVIDMLRSGQTVQLKGSCSPGDWCEVVGWGWVWGHLQF
jgi:hypothetical protein